MNLEALDPATGVRRLEWSELDSQLRQDLNGRLVGLWGAESDEAAFNALPIDKQQALLLLMDRLQAQSLWHLIKSIGNVYGEGGGGREFVPLASFEATLTQRKDFTRRWARHRDTSGGFYEKSRTSAVLHFLYVNGGPRRWYVHFDLHIPVHSAASAFRHVRHEFLSKSNPDWRMIAAALGRKPQSSS